MKYPSDELTVRITNDPSKLARVTVCVAVFLSLAAASCLQATVLDNFNSATRTGWTDTPNGGYLALSGGQLEVTTADSASALTYGAKTAQSFANAANQTLEFRVDVNAVTPGNGDPNPVAILAWLPAGATPGSGTSGYSLSVSAGSVSLQKGATVLYTTNYTAAATNLPNTTLALRMTPSGGNLTVNARVYRQTGSQPLQTFTEIFEYTATVADAVGADGYAALGVRSGASPSGATVYFDNLQAFVLANSVLDDFSGGSGDVANYSVTGYGAANVTGGQIELATLQAPNNPLYVAARRKTPNFTIVDGSRIEMSVVVVNNVNGYIPAEFAALSYTPANDDSGVAYLLGYHIGAGIYGLSMGKAYGEWWVNQKPYPWVLTTGSPVPSSNVRLSMSMTGEGTSVRIESRVEDLNVTEVNDPARWLYQSVFVDTAGADPFDMTDTPNYPDGTVGPASGFLNLPGSIVLYAFQGGDGGNGSDVFYDNLAVSQTEPVNQPPVFDSVFPPDGSNFVAGATSVTFHILDDANTPIDNIKLTLNGVSYTNGSPGVTITGGNQDRLFTFAGALVADTFYSGLLQAADDHGAATSQKYSFDTFRTNTCYVVECEDYNYLGGQYVEPYSTPAVNQYQGQWGTPEVDFHDSRTSMDAANSVYRQDPVRNNVSGDGPRPKYVGAYPGEVVVVDRQNGDWLDYTHNYPAGYYSAYMRMSQYLLPQSIISLERVTSDPTQPSQTTAVLGAFLGTATGYDINRDVPLTDAFGHPVLVHFSGSADTIRVNNQQVQASNTELWQNYLVFAPATSPGSLPPFVATVSPLPGAIVGSSGSPNYSASIVNRDSSVDTSSIIMKINGVAVPASASPTAGGASVTWTPAGTTAIFTNTLIFKDNLNVWQTNTWTYSYTAVLWATNSLPLGSLNVRGFDCRMVQSDNGGANLDNSLSRALQQLAIPPTIAIDRTATSIVQVLNWNKVSAPPNNVPGLCSGSYLNIAVESLAYLELSAGVHRFYINTDDRAGLYSGASLEDPNAVALWENPGNTASSTFDFVVEAAGLYPVRCIWEETGGGAALALKSVNLSDNSQVLINDSADPTGVVKAWYPIVCKSSSSVTGPYTAAASATQTLNPLVDVASTDCGPTVVGQMGTGGKFTVPISGAAQFFRLDGPRSGRITSATRVGSNIVITYQTP